MSKDITGYSSHDWRKNTDSAVVIDDNVEHKSLKVNDSRVIFINPKTLKAVSYTHLTLPTICSV